MRDYERRIQRMEIWLDKPKAEIAEASISVDATSANMQDYVRAFYDLIFHAFQTDSTRVVTHMLGIEGGGSKSDHFPALGFASSSCIEPPQGIQLQGLGVCGTNS